VPLTYRRFALTPEPSAEEKWQADFARREVSLVPLTTRLPVDLVLEIKRRAIVSTIQILAEHAYTLYLGSRLPPDLWGGYEWPEDFPSDPPSPYLSGKVRSFTIRIPRRLLRWSQIYALDAGMTEQELALRVYDWYIRRGLIPPARGDVRRDANGRLHLSEPLLVDRFPLRDSDQILEAFELLAERHTKFGGPLASRHKRKGTSRAGAETDR
jgi:hypothetical protein